MIIDWCDCFDSHFGADETNGGPEVATADVRLVGSTDGAYATGCELWAHYGFAYRPPDPDGDKRCQAIVYDAGGTRIILASRDVRGADSHGALNKGDVALWSTGKNTFRLNAGGGISMLQQTDDADASISIEKDGTIILANRYGAMSLGADGFTVTLATGEQIALGEAIFQAFAPQGFVRCGVVGLGPAPSKPLDTGAGAAAVPIPYILG